MSIIGKPIYKFEHLDKVDWCLLSCNPNVIHILENNLEKINWYYLSRNCSVEAIQLLKENIDKIDWSQLSLNNSVEAIQLLKENPSKIDWHNLSQNMYIFN